MDYKKTKQWLDDHGVILEESFYTALNNLAKDYKKTNDLKLLEEVYQKLGVNKQAVSWWKNHPCSTQTRQSKIQLIVSCAEIFHLTTEETELLANKAGLSLSSDHNFSVYFRQLLNGRRGRCKSICDAANVSERMFQYIKHYKQPSKETLLAIAISLGLGIDEIQHLLKKAGYTLSASLPNDAVVCWFLSGDRKADGTVPVLFHINEVLDELKLPLLMTRLKSS
ncbi:MAG: hypothetical protein E7249_19000 [Paenibacillaceae bacterium]|nr:hypothetical protein [Paenibacillaceae bacterium]